MLNLISKVIVNYWFLVLIFIGYWNLLAINTKPVLYFYFGRKGRGGFIKDMSRCIKRFIAHVVT